MTGEERRNEIIRTIKDSIKPIAGSKLADMIYSLRTEGIIFGNIWSASIKLAIQMRKWKMN